ncbi:MAG: PilZ domain-containing protein [Caulobacteraceae bacterium]|nr:PilZ domain-containing protein [Caulobacteraceae bacterium]
MDRLPPLQPSSPTLQSATEAVGDARRREPRLRTLLTGKLVFGPHDMTADCTIRNLTAGGAKITTSLAAGLPPEFWLIVVRQNTAYRAAVAWRRGEELGLRFEGQHDLSEPSRDPALNVVRHVWRELAAR